MTLLTRLLAVLCFCSTLIFSQEGQPLALTKSFADSSINIGGTTTLSFNVENPNGFAVGNGSFTDTLPAGLVYAFPGNFSTACGGNVAVTTTSATFTNLAIAAGPTNCALAGLAVIGATDGLKINTTSPISSSVGTGAPATATITVLGAPTLSKSFTPSQLQLFGAGSTLSFTITNPNASTALTNIAFSDTLPVGLIISTPNDLANGCAGTITANAGTNNITLLGGSLGAGASCTFSVSVTGTAVGVQTNTTSAITATGLNVAVVGEAATAQAEVNALFFLWFFHESGGGKP